MMAYWGPTTGVNDGRRWMTVTTSATTTATTTVTWYANCTTINYALSPAEPPKIPPEYIALRKVVLGRDRMQPQMVAGRIIAAALPRGRLLRWKSLKEKRQAWGVA